MPDLIDQAVNQATAAGTGAVSSAQNAATGTATAIAANALGPASQALGAAAAAQQKFENLPFDKDPDILARQKEAEIQQKKAELEELKLKLEETAVEEGKKKLLGLAISLLPSIPKIIIDPKILMAVSILLQAKSLAKKRKKSVKENLEKGRKLYKYDIKKELPKPPITDLPLKIPDVPTLPTLPNIPNLPTL
jgi:hypothetical protein